MSEHMPNDVYRRLEFMKQIVQGVQSGNTEKKKKGKEHDDPISLVDVNGMVNHKARTQLLEQIHDIQELFAKPIHQREQNQSRGWSIGSMFSSCQKRVQIFLSESVRTSTNFNSALATFFKEFQFKSDILVDMSNIKETLPLFVVCPMSTRVEPDIDHSISGLEWISKYAVLIVHSGLESSLPQLSTSVTLHGNPKYSNIEFIDVAFSEERGFYYTEMNTKARKLIKEFAVKA